MHDRYIIVAGNSFKSPRGGDVFTSLSVVATAGDKRMASTLYADLYDKHGGLIIIVDKETNKEVIP